MVGVGSEVGGYRLREVLGEGGFGVVFLGENPDGQLGAVKIMHARHERDEEFRERFAREVELARQVASFCTARVLGADPRADRPWVINEYVEGRTLAETVRGEGPHDESDLYRLAVSTATALAAIHAVGVVHRDFKPENIMLAPDGPRVIDFGIARALEGTRASASALIGTPRYMAPEQLEGQDVTPAIDLFAWGAVVVFAATGKDAFDGPTQAAILRRILMGEPDLEGVPESLLGPVTQCLAKDPAGRPTSERLLAALLGYDTGSRPAADEAIQRGETLTAQSGRLSLPPMTIMGDSDMAGYAYGPGPVPRTTPPAAGFGTGPETGRPFSFRGRPVYTPEELAEAMQLDWDATLALQQSAPQRRSLQRWLPDNHPAQGLLDHDPGTGAAAEVATAWLIARLGPGLSPCYRDTELTLTHLQRAIAENRRSTPFTEGSSLEKVLLAGIMRPLSLHHCHDPQHECAPDAPCVPYGQAVDTLESVTEAIGTLQAWTGELQKAVDNKRRFVFRADPLRLLGAAMKPPPVSTTPDRLADWVFENVYGWQLEQVRPYVEDMLARIPEGKRWGTAVVLREARSILNDIDSAIRSLRAWEAERPREEERQAVRAKLRAERAELDSFDTWTVLCTIAGVVLAFFALALIPDTEGDNAIAAFFVGVLSGSAFLTAVARALLRHDRKKDLERREYQHRRPLHDPTRALKLGRNTTPPRARTALEELLTDLPDTVISAVAGKERAM